ncbi:hypothetical protein SS50377_23076 [Spironucleus salmonicida]|uniref:Uncharacterized protein n=1 Tax=Spironucleus salmonicida TaxID=348837 RepID=V6LTT6_9EUKA|nr:hypothetical protein SS50377_23076 [Spironucleus salmonicida]|eukprot:EST47653.1 Hypothetical protein SS50377_12348 [Spironucleus salmonicida]
MSGQCSVVGSCIINPLLDNKNVIYKPSSKEVGAFSYEQGAQIRQECNALKTHKMPKKQQGLFDPIQEQKKENLWLTNQKCSHNILNKGLNNYAEFSSTQKTQLQDALQQIPQDFKVKVNENRDKERARVEYKYAHYNDN